MPATLMLHQVVTMAPAPSPDAQTSSHATTLLTLAATMARVTTRGATMRWHVISMVLQVAMMDHAFSRLLLATTSTQIPSTIKLAPIACAKDSCLDAPIAMPAISTRKQTSTTALA